MRRILSAVQIAPNAESLLNETQFGGWRQPARLPWIAIGILDIIYLITLSLYCHYFLRRESAKSFPGRTFVWER